MPTPRDAPRTRPLPRGSTLRRPRRSPIATTSLLAALLFGAAACEASVDEDGAELDIEEDAFDGDDT
jgi:hypothetical protein